MFSWAFCDFGPEFEVLDSTGEEPKEFFLWNITKVCEKYQIEYTGTITMKLFRIKNRILGSILPLLFLLHFISKCLLQNCVAGKSWCGDNIRQSYAWITDW